MKQIKKCSICGRDTKVCNTEIGLLCGKHYLQYKRHGKILSRTKYDPNEFIIEDSIVKIYLYNSSGEKIEETIIDKDKYDSVKDFKWCLDPNGYVKNSKHQYLHRFVTGEKNLFVDHINGNKLDNRLENLRICCNADNLKNRVNLPKSNTSGVIGVRYREDRHKWYASIQCNNQKINLGSFITKEEAIQARIKAELEYFGEYKSKILNNEINKTEL